MVEALGPRPVASEARVQRTSLARAVSSLPTTPVPSTSVSPGDTAALSGVAKTMAVAAPVDADRVARVKKAIEQGDFPILPATIADRMIAVKYEWMSSDAQA